MSTEMLIPLNHTQPDTRKDLEHDGISDFEPQGPPKDT